MIREIKKCVKRIVGHSEQWGYLGKNCMMDDAYFYNKQYIFISDNVRIGHHSELRCYDFYADKKLSPRLKIGKNFLAGAYFKVLCAGNITIGDDVTFAGNVFITDENHGVSPLTNNYLENSLEISDVIIENGVWGGEKVVILPGVRIGEKSIIGAGSVVTKSIPAYSIAAGNPCRVIKEWDGAKWVRVGLE